MPSDEPRVRLYGFLPITFGRYVTQSVVECVVMVALLVGWFFYWPYMSKRLEPFDLPTVMVIIRAILTHLPWILLGLAIFKAIELLVMLRAFAFQQVARKQSPEGNSGDG